MKITALPEGPFIVEGATELILENGESYALDPKVRTALCRCGGSLHAPLCDAVRGGHQCAPAAMRETWREEGGLVARRALAVSQPRAEWEDEAGARAPEPQ